MPLFEATSNFISALDAFATCEHARHDAVQVGVPVIGAATAVISAAATLSVASAVVSAPAVALATGHSVRRSVELAPVRMAVQS